MRGFIVYDELATVNILHVSVEHESGLCYLDLLLKSGDAELLPDPPEFDRYAVGLLTRSDSVRSLSVRCGEISILAKLALFIELRPAGFAEIPPDIWTEIEREASIRFEQDRIKEPMPMIAKFQLFPYDEAGLRWYSVVDMPNGTSNSPPANPQSSDSRYSPTEIPTHP